MTALHKNERIKVTKKFRFYTAVIVAVVFAAALNIVFGMADSKYNSSLDLTNGQYTTLTNSSKTMIGSMNRNIYLFYVGSSQQQDIITTQLLKSYSSVSKKVHFTVIDPRYYAQMLSGFKGATSGSVIISDTDILSGAQPGAYTVLTSSDIYSGAVNGSKNTSSGRVLFSGEQKITSAIEYIEGGTVDRVVFLTGDDEEKPCDSLLEDLNSRFYKTDFQNAESKFDPSSDTLIIISPNKDISSSASENIKGFLDSGGHAMFIINSVDVNDTTGKPGYPQELKNLGALLAEYGVRVDPDIIIGGDPSKTYKFPANIIPYVSPVGASRIAIDPNTRPVIEYMSPINIKNTSDVFVTPLLETDASCYSEPVTNGLTGIKNTATDTSGPFMVGAIVQKNDTLMALFTSPSFVVTEEDYTYQGNARLFLNTLSFLGHRMGSVSIPVKIIYSSRDTSYRLINVSGIMKGFLILVVVCVLPFIAISVGLYRRAKRRKV